VIANKWISELSELRRGLFGYSLRQGCRVTFKKFISRTKCLNM